MISIIDFLEVQNILYSTVHVAQEAGEAPFQILESVFCSNETYFSNSFLPFLLLSISEKCDVHGMNLNYILTVYIIIY